MHELRPIVNELNSNRSKQFVLFQIKNLELFKSEVFVNISKDPMFKYDHYEEFMTGRRAKALFGRVPSLKDYPIVPPQLLYKWKGPILRPERQGYNFNSGTNIGEKLVIFLYLIHSDEPSSVAYSFATQQYDIVNLFSAPLPASSKQYVLGYIIDQPIMSRLLSGTRPVRRRPVDVIDSSLVPRVEPGTTNALLRRNIATKRASNRGQRAPNIAPNDASPNVSQTRRNNSNAEYVALKRLVAATGGYKNHLRRGPFKNAAQRVLDDGHFVSNMKFYLSKENLNVVRDACILIRNVAGVNIASAEKLSDVDIIAALIRVLDVHRDQMEVVEAAMGALDNISFSGKSLPMLSESRELFNTISKSGVSDLAGKYANSIIAHLDAPAEAPANLFEQQNKDRIAGRIYRAPTDGEPEEENWEKEPANFLEERNKNRIAEQIYRPPTDGKPEEENWEKEPANFLEERNKNRIAEHIYRAPEPEGPVVAPSEPEGPVVAPSEPEGPVVAPSEPEGPVVAPVEPKEENWEKEPANFLEERNKNRIAAHIYAKNINRVQEAKAAENAVTAEVAKKSPKYANAQTQSNSKNTNRRKWKGIDVKGAWKSLKNMSRKSLQRLKLARPTEQKPIIPSNGILKRATEGIKAMKRARENAITARKLRVAGRRHVPVGPSIQNRIRKFSQAMEKRHRNTLKKRREVIARNAAKPKSPGLFGWMFGSKPAPVANTTKRNNKPAEPPVVTPLVEAAVAATAPPAEPAPAPPPVVAAALANKGNTTRRLPLRARLAAFNAVKQYSLGLKNQNARGGAIRVLKRLAKKWNIPPTEANI